MNSIINYFITLSFEVRVAVVLLIMLVLWCVLGKGVFWILSIIPFLLEKTFVLIYRIIELPIALLHKTLGGTFYKIDNFMSGFGERIDGILKKWYDHWHSKYKFNVGKTILLYILCFAIIVLPSMLSLKSNALNIGKELYLKGENMVIEWYEKMFPQDFEEDVMVDKSEQIPKDEEVKEPEIELVVSGVNSVLLVRNVPDMDGYVVLERLHNDDKVIWKGELIFAEAENNHVESWVKVTTQSGLEGWSRLLYLRPIDYESSSFYVKEVQK